MNKKKFQIHVNDRFWNEMRRRFNPKEISCYDTISFFTQNSYLQVKFQCLHILIEIKRSSNIRFRRLRLKLRYHFDH